MAISKRATKKPTARAAVMPKPAAAPGAITLDGNLSEWTAADRLDTVGGTAGYALYGAVTGDALVFAMQVPVGVAIGSGTTIWLNTDLATSTGYQVFGFAAGAEYNINFDAAGNPALYTGAAGETLVGAVSVGFNADRTAVEFSVARSAVGNASAAGVYVDVNDGVFLPSSYSSFSYVLSAGSGTAQGKVIGSITLDGALGDWTAAERIDRAGTGTTGYEVYGKAAGDSYVIAIKAPTAIGGGTTAWINSDRNAATGYQIFGFAGGAEYNITFDAAGRASLYSGAAGQTLLLANLDTAFSADKTVVEFTVSKASLGNPTAIDTLLDVNDAVFLPGSYSAAPYTIYDSTITRTDPTKRVGIVYSETSANAYFDKTAYSQLFMTAQSQAMQAGISFDLLTEADLTDLAKLSNYDTLIFPSFRNVQADKVTAITNTLSQASAQFGLGLIAAGDFMTNDASGAALPGDSYARMKLLFDATRVAGGFPANVDVRSSDTDKLVLENFANGELIRSYQNIGWNAFASVSGTGKTIATETVGGQTYSAVLATQTGGRNVLFSTEGVMADSNLLWQAIDYAVNGTGVSVGLQLTRNASIVASRNDMDQSQESYDVNPDDNAAGIYDRLLPIVEQWKKDYNFVGSYYVNVGNNPAGEQMTDWAVSGAYYKKLIELGNEIGTHSYTHPEDTNLLTPAQIEFEFNQSKKVIEQQMSAILGRPFTVEGAAVPGAPEKLPTSTEILKYFDYVSGGYSSVGAGYPGGFGYMTPGLTDAVYIAPNTSFDFTLIGFQNKTPAEAEAQWAKEWSELTAKGETPIVVWPWHDYGPTQWEIDEGVASEYTREMFTNFIARAAAAGAEFVTLDDLADRIESFDDSGVTSTVNGNVITAKVSSADAGLFSLDVDGQGVKVIQNVAGWYAYDNDSVFLPKAGGSFTITLGAVADDVTRITALPMRAKLISLSGDGSNLAFTAVGEGLVTIDLKNPAGKFVSVTGATVKSRVGEILTLDIGAVGSHSVSVVLAANAAPVITSNGGGDAGSVGVAENATAVLTVVASDGNLAAGDRLTYGIAGGSDAALFAIDAATGALSFRNAPDFEAAADSNRDNIYVVVVKATDLAGATDQQSLSIGVTNVVGVTKTGTGGNDALVGTSENDVLNGGNGNDTITGAAGADALNGDSGNDTLNGDAGTDTLKGGSGNDTLNGGNDADLLIGGSGDDRMTGGAGNDVFRFETTGDSGSFFGFMRDDITDFTKGQDRIDVSAIDANTSRSAGGNQAFTLLSTAGARFTAPGQLRFSYTTIGGVQHTIIEGNVDSFSMPDFSIDVVGRIAFTAGDFIL